MQYSSIGELVFAGRRLLRVFVGLFLDWSLFDSYDRTYDGSL